MRILITGGYGFIGSFIAERFFKEGHDIYIIDNLSTGCLENLACRHKFYNIDVNDINCDEIFRNCKFDIVIHLAADVDEEQVISSPYINAKTNILGLVNMLELSSKYKVSKFIFASSAAVYGNKLLLTVKEEDKCEPFSPFTMSKMQGEIYCQKWSEIYHLDVVIFRFSNVYGPRQRANGEGSIISCYIDQVMKNQELIVYGSGNQKLDFIYVLDLVEAVYRAAESYVTGIFNLSSNTRYSVSDLIDLFKKFGDVQGVINKEPKNEEILGYSLDNTKLKRAIDWVPIYSFEEGVRRTYDWFKENLSENTVKEEKKKINFLKKVFVHLLPYLENLLCFITVILLDNYLRDDSVIRTVDLKMVYIIIMGVFYGMHHSLLAFLLSSVAITIEALNLGRDFFSMLMDSNFYIQILSYGLFGIAVGNTIDRKNKQISFEKLSYQSLDEKFLFLKELYNDTYTVKCELQNQIANAEDGIGKIYGMIKALDSMEAKHVYTAAIDVLKGILKTNEITILKSTDFLNEYLNEYNEVFAVLNTGEIYVNKDMKPDIPLIISPLMVKGKLNAVILINKTKFEMLTLSYLNLVRVATGLVNAALIRAYKYEAAISNERQTGEFQIKDETISAYKFKRIRR